MSSNKKQNSTANQYPKEIIDKYISTLSSIEIKTMKIAEEDLNTSFDIEKSIGFLNWVNKNIPENTNVIIINRPIANFKNFAVSGGFNYFTNSEEARYYKKLIKNYKIDYLVYLGNAPDLMHLKNCVGEIYKFRENVGFHATRNPFNTGSYYNAYIFEFENNKLDTC